MDSFYLNVLIAVIGVIIGMMIALSPDAVVVVSGTDVFTVEYDDIVYRLMELK